MLWLKPIRLLSLTQGLSLELQRQKR